MMKMWSVVLILSFLFNYGCTKPVEMEAEMSVSNQGTIDESSYGSIFDTVKSSVYGATSKASNLMEYISSINNNSLLSLSDKAQLLSQLASFSSNQLSTISGLFGMLGDVFIAHMEWKLKVIKAAKEQFDLGMQALANGDTEAAKMYFYEALYTLPTMCPLYHALKYALNTEDWDMTSFVGKMGQLILGQMENAAVDVDVSLSQ